jgi:hypothetical protein
MFRILQFVDLQKLLQNAAPHADLAAFDSADRAR